MTTVDFKGFAESLRTWLEGATGEKFGLGEKPKDVESKHAWGVVHFIPGGEFYGSMRFPESDAELIVQIDSVGLRYDQALHLGDTVRRTMLARTASGAFQVAPPDVSPWAINNRRSPGTPGGPVPGGEPERRVYSLPERFVVCITPA